jgi:16S rRNA (guanine1516-N2)-methyltransferase
MTKKTIAVSFTAEEQQKQAEILANELNLPFVTSASHEDYQLIVTPFYLGLKKKDSPSNPLYVEFLSPQMQFRQRNVTLKNENLIRALGLKKNQQPKIIDATGGLGRDSFIIASCGFEVTILERSPIIHALLRDGIERAKQKISALNRLHLVQADAINWLRLARDQNQPDIIYLDPMFPERKKSALPKKEMLIFHDIVGDDLDSSALLTAALACAKQRVVVKRARLAPYLSEKIPAYSLKGTSCRFDIYLT